MQKLALVSSLALVVPVYTVSAQTVYAELRQGHLPPGAHASAIGDVDGDGDLDVVSGREPETINWFLGEFEGGQNRLYLNDGTGVFEDATASRMPMDEDFTRAVAMGDVDGDGDLDLVIGNSSVYPECRIPSRLYLNDGTGRFTDVSSSQFPSDGPQVRSIALGDVDGDRDLDIVFGSDTGCRNQLYLNDGTGVFTDVTTAQLPDAAEYVALGDVDGDGDLDLVASGWHPSGFDPDVFEASSSLLINDGKGVFTDVTVSQFPVMPGLHRYPRFGDMDGDQDLDIVFGNALLQNDGKGIFTRGTFTDSTFFSMHRVFRGADLGDVDADGDLDLVRSDKLFVNDGKGELSDVGPSMFPPGVGAPLLGDLDGDADLDVIGSKVYLNEGQGSFVTTSPPTNRWGIDPIWADVDGDGDLDSVWSSELSLNDGNGVFTDVTATQLPPNPVERSSVAIGDVDGDGDFDLVIDVLYDPRVELYLNDGRGFFTRATDGRPKAAGGLLGDVDGDGDLDLVQGSAVHLNDGTGDFSVSNPLPGTFSSLYVLGDLDGDGDQDIVRAPGVVVELLLNDGTGKFGNPILVHQGGPDYALALALGDVDGDGDLDLVFGGAYAGTGGSVGNSLYLNDGMGKLTFGGAFGDTHTGALAFGDVDLDGDLDLVVGTSTEGQEVFIDHRDRLYLNDGTGIFVDATDLWLPMERTSTTYLNVGDLDGDGDLEVMLGPWRHRVLFNHHIQTRTPRVPILSRSYAIDFYAKPGYGSSFHFAIPALNLELATTPMSVPPYGTFSLELDGLIGLPWVPIPPWTGKGTLQFTVPADLSLIGRTVYTQALIINLAQGWSGGPLPPDSHLTGYTADVILK